MWYVSCFDSIFTQITSKNTNKVIHAERCSHFFLGKIQFRNVYIFTGFSLYIFYFFALHTSTYEFGDYNFPDNYAMWSSLFENNLHTSLFWNCYQILFHWFLNECFVSMVLALDFLDIFLLIESIHEIRCHKTRRAINTSTSLKFIAKSKENVNVHWLLELFHSLFYQQIQ